MTLLEHQIRTESPHHRRSRPCWHLWPVLAGVGGCLLSGAAGGAIVLAVHGTGSPAAATGAPVRIPGGWDRASGGDQRYPAGRGHRSGRGQCQHPPGRTGRRRPGPPAPA
jgi:hypothetical protein